MACRIFWTVLIHLSRMLPKWEPYGGLKDHLMFFCNSELWIFSWFQYEIVSRSSRLPLVKFVPLSETISFTWPLLAINLRRANRNESVSKQCATSKCTARIARHVKITQYRRTCADVRGLLAWRGTCGKTVSWTCADVHGLLAWRGTCVRTVNWFISTRRVCMEDCEMFPATIGNRTLFPFRQILAAWSLDKYPKQMLLVINNCIRSW